MSCVPARVPPGEGEHNERRLSLRAEVAWYVVAGITYIAAGSVHKVLLTWLVGPAWVVLTLWFGPIVFDVHRLRHAWVNSAATRRDTGGSAEGDGDSPRWSP
jgi:hypothetical protein